MVLSEISIKLIFLPQRKESSVPLLVIQIHFMAPMVCLRAFTSSLCTEACIFAKYLSFYTYLILCELWMRVTIVAKLVQILAKFPHSPIHHYTSIYGALLFSVSPVRCTCIIKYGAVRKFFPNCLAGTWIVLSSVEFFYFGSKSRSSLLITCLLHGLPKTLPAKKLLESNCFS